MIDEAEVKRLHEQEGRQSERRTKWVILRQHVCEFLLGDYGL